MGRTVTVVAQDPNHEAHPGEENNSAIQAVMDALVSFRDPSRHAVLRAPSVEELAIALSKDLKENGAPEVLQIIGHGIPGALSLGAGWSPPQNGQKLARVLDSNPDKYGVLERCVESTTKVWLLGCAVGAGGNIPHSQVADGPTLLFDLSRMWSCEVSAPVGLVDPAKDFDEEGRFRHPKTFVTARDRSVTPEPATAAKLGTGAARASRA